MLIPNFPPQRQSPHSTFSSSRARGVFLKPRRFLRLTSRRSYLRSCYQHRASPVIGAFRVDDGARRRDVLFSSCTSHCFNHRFAVSPGVYLVRLTFATAALSRQAPFDFVLNGRTFDVEFDAAAVAESDDPLIKYFLVRPDGNLIVLASKATTDTALITEVNILHFDTNHGDGPQAISW